MTKKFDKTIYTSNIRMLAEENKVKISELEKIAGVSSGYISRIDKEGSSAALSVEALYKISEVLNVSLDDLVYGIMSELSTTERILLKFIRQITSDTKEDALVWHCKSKLEMESYDLEKVRQGYYPFLYVATRHVENEKGEDKTECVGVEDFPGLFGIERINGSWYFCQLPDENYLWVTDVSINDFISKNEEQAYELYMLSFDNTFEGYENCKGNWRKEGLCTTFACKQSIKLIMNSLVKEITASGERIHFNAWAEDSIREYIKSSS